MDKPELYWPIAELHCALLLAHDADICPLPRSSEECSAAVAANSSWSKAWLDKSSAGYCRILTIVQMVCCRGTAHRTCGGKIEGFFGWHFLSRPQTELGVKLVTVEIRNICWCTCSHDKYRYTLSEVHSQGQGESRNYTFDWVYYFLIFSSKK